MNSSVQHMIWVSLQVVDGQVLEHGQETIIDSRIRMVLDLVIPVIGILIKNKGRSLTGTTLKLEKATILDPHGTLRIIGHVRSVLMTGSKTRVRKIGGKNTKNMNIIKSRMREDIKETTILTMRMDLGKVERIINRDLQNLLLMTK